MAGPREKLGLALAGGGLRASFFHVGVLRRLAELDILRRVEVLSTVSGGSITGAMYMLLLKKYMEQSETTTLSRDQYVALVDEVGTRLEAGARKNLRTRLFMNPIGTLIVMLTSDSLARRMSRLYERYLFAPIVRDLKDVAAPPWWRFRWSSPGWIRMEDLTIRPGGKPIEGDVSAWNEQRRSRGESVATSIVLNATSVNSGGRFHISADEVGDWYLGYFRKRDFDSLLDRKALLDQADGELQKIVDAPLNTEKQRAAALLLLRRAPTGEAADAARRVWAPLFEIDGFPGLLESVDFGVLRRAQIAAWHLRVDRPQDAAQLKDHERRFWSALHDIDPDLVVSLRSWRVDQDAGSAIRDRLLDYVLELYWHRSADCMSGKIKRDWERLSLGHAVGASACFPPVFPPFLVHGIYDDLHVSRLGLTDGGVYDNMGITALVNEGCTEIIASDTGGVFQIEPVSPTGRGGLSLRIPELLMLALGGTQRLGLRERARASDSLSDVLEHLGEESRPAIEEFLAGRRLDSLVYFHMDSPRIEPMSKQQRQQAEKGASPRVARRSSSREAAAGRYLPEPREVAELRTDLDGFGAMEVAALVGHGYDLTDRYVRRYASGLCQPTSPPARKPNLRFADLDPVLTRRVLAVGRGRVFRSLKLRSAVSLVSALALATLVIWFVWARGITVDSMLTGAARLVTSWVANFDAAVGWIAGGPDADASRSPIFLAGLLALVTVVLLALAWRRPRQREKGTRPRRSWFRTLVTAWKWVRAFRGNLLWVLYGLPLIVAVAAAVVSTISYLCFHLPFMFTTRLRGAARAQPGAVEVAPIAPAKPRPTADDDVPVPLPFPPLGEEPAVGEGPRPPA